jgi:hypothetical protein
MFRLYNTFYGTFIIWNQIFITKNSFNVVVIQAWHYPTRHMYKLRTYISVYTVLMLVRVMAVSALMVITLNVSEKL